MRTATIALIAWTSAAQAQINFPDDETITYSTDVGLRLKNQGSKGVLELKGNYNGQEPLFKVEAQTNATAAWIKAVTDGRPTALIELNTCSGSTSACFAVHAKVPAGAEEGGNGTALRGEGKHAGVWATANEYAIRAEANNNTSAEGVHASTGTGFAVHAIATGTHAIRAEALSGNGVWATTGTSSTTGVHGENTASSGNAWGVVGRTGSQTEAQAVFGDTGHISNGHSGFFTGKVAVVGSLSKGAGSFKIDHPLDPEKKYLYHSFVESPDMMNVYNGIVTLGASGSATIQMPAWFSALNRDFRYQLTSIGQFAPVYVSAEMNQNNQFMIAGGTPGQRISWQVTGIRQDPYANAHRIPLEENKTGSEVGKYLHAEAWGMPVLKAIKYGPPSPAAPSHNP